RQRARENRALAVRELVDAPLRADGDPALREDCLTLFVFGRHPPPICLSTHAARALSFAKRASASQSIACHWSSGKRLVRSATPRTIFLCSAIASRPSRRTMN